MSGNGVKLLYAVLLLCAFAHLSGCGSQGAAQPAAPEAGSDAGPAGPTTQFPGGLPTPADIPRGARALQLVRQGADCLPGYGQGVTASGTDLVFSADTTAGHAGLAWALYELYPDAQAWELSRVLHTAWRSTPHFADCWLGLANWETGRWDWLPYDPVQDRPIGATQHLDADGRLLAAVLVTDGSATLARVRYGQNQPPAARFTVERSAAALPFTVTLRAQDIAEDGELAQIEFDPDGSGFIAVAPLTQYQFAASQPGTHACRLRLVDDEGAERVYASGWSSDTYYIWDGGSAYPDSLFYDIAPLPGGGFYAVGLRSPENLALLISGVLVAKYGADGSLLWSRTLECKPEDFQVTCAAGPADSLYVSVVGDTNMYPTKLLTMARFEADGSVAWQQRWGDCRVDSQPPPNLLADNAAGRLYVGCGIGAEFGQSEPLVLACFDGATGTEQWSKALTAGPAQILALRADGLAQDGSGNLLLAGLAYDTGAAPGPVRPAIAKLAPDGTLLAARAYTIPLDAPRAYYFGGAGDSFSLLLRQSGASDTAPLMLQVDADLALLSLRRIAGYTGTLFTGEINPAADGGVWLSNTEGSASQLLHFGSDGQLVLALGSAAYLPALGLAADGSLLSAGWTASGLPDWQPLAFTLEELSATGAAITLTTTDWNHPVLAASYTASDVQSAAPPAGGGLVFRLQP